MDYPEKPNERDRATVWLDSRWVGDRRCPICQHDTWSVTEVLEIRPHFGGTINVGGPVYPIFQAICTNCGFFHSFNAVLSGVVVDEPESR